MDNSPRLRDIVNVGEIRTRFDMARAVSQIPTHVMDDLKNTLVKAEHRTWLTLHDEVFTLYLIRWPFATQTTIHDHINSNVHIDFLEGVIREELYYPAEWKSLLAGKPTPTKYSVRDWDSKADCHCMNEAYIGSRYVHRFTGASREAAITLHAYLPRLTSMHNFEFRRAFPEGNTQYPQDGRLALTGIETW